MEPLGVAASITGVIQLTGKVTSLAYQYIGGVMGASKDLLNLVKELSSLVQVLGYLQDYANINPQSLPLKRLNEQGGPLRGCIVELQRLRLKMEPKDGIRGVFQCLKWPLQESETLQHISRIERHKSLFALVLTLDQAALLKEIGKYVQDTGLAIEKFQARSIALSKEIGSYAQNTNLTVQDIRADFHIESTTQEIWRKKEDIMRATEKREKVLNWLCLKPIQGRHIEIQNRRQKNTGGWILVTPELQGWITGGLGSQILWGYGIAGAGKSFLSSVVIDHLQALTTTCGVGYIYFDYKERVRQRPIDVLASLVKQLTRRIPHLPAEIEAHTTNMN